MPGEIILGVSGAPELSVFEIGLSPASLRSSDAAKPPVSGEGVKPKPKTASGTALASASAVASWARIVGYKDFPDIPRAQETALYEKALR